MESGAWDKGGRVPSATFSRWAETVDDFKKDEKLGRAGILPELMDADLLLLDDVGADDDPWKVGVNKLCQILNRRETKFTVITTNFPPDQWPQRFDTRIADRLLRNSEVVDLFGVPSYAMVERGLA